MSHINHVDLLSEGGQHWIHIILTDVGYHDMTHPPTHNPGTLRLDMQDARRLRDQLSERIAEAERGNDTSGA